MKCTNCGKEVPESANVCGYCGTRLKKAQPVQPAAETPKPAPAKKAPVKKAEVKTEKHPQESIASKLKKIPIWIWGTAVIAIIAVSIVLLIPKQEKGGPMELLEGTWKGSAENKMDGSTFEVTFYFPDDCELLSYCGSVNIPEFNLSSEVMITSVSGDNYEFFVRVNEALPEDEVPYEYLKYINSTRVEFYSVSDDWDEQGTLYKQ